MNRALLTRLSIWIGSLTALTLGGCVPSSAPDAGVAIESAAPSGADSTQQELRFNGSAHTPLTVNIRVSASRADYKRGSLTAPAAAANCTGSIISDNHVLTAAHCLASNAFSGLQDPNPWRESHTLASGTWVQVPTKPTYLPGTATAWPTYYSAVVVECAEGSADLYEDGNVWPSGTVATQTGYVDGTHFRVATHVAATSKDIGFVYISSEPANCTVDAWQYDYTLFLKTGAVTYHTTRTEREIRFGDGFDSDTGFVGSRCEWVHSDSGGRFCDSDADCTCTAGGTTHSHSCGVAGDGYGILYGTLAAGVTQRGTPEPGNTYVPFHEYGWLQMAGQPLNGWMQLSWMGTDIDVGAYGTLKGKRHLQFDAYTQPILDPATGTNTTEHQMVFARQGDDNTALPGASGGPWSYLYDYDVAPSSAEPSKFGVAGVLVTVLDCESIADADYCAKSPSCEWKDSGDVKIGYCDEKSAGSLITYGSGNGIQPVWSARTELKSLMETTPAATASSSLFPDAKDTASTTDGVAPIIYACTTDYTYFPYMTDDTTESWDYKKSYDDADGWSYLRDVLCSTVPASTTTAVAQLQADNTCLGHLNSIVQAGLYSTHARFSQGLYLDEVMHLEFLDDGQSVTDSYGNGFPSLRKISSYSQKTCTAGDIGKRDRLCTANTECGTNGVCSLPATKPFGEQNCLYEVGYNSYNTSTGTYTVKWIPLVRYVMAMLQPYRAYDAGSAVEPLTVQEGQRLMFTTEGYAAKYCNFRQCTPSCQAGCEVIAPLEAMKDERQIANLQTCGGPTDSGLPAASFYGSGSWICRSGNLMVVDPGAVMLTQLAAQFLMNSSNVNPTGALPTIGKAAFVSPAADAGDWAPLFAMKNDAGTYLTELEKWFNGDGSTYGFVTPRDPADYSTGSYLQYVVRENVTYITTDAQASVDGKYLNKADLLGQTVTGVLLEAALYKAPNDVWTNIVGLAMAPATTADIDAISAAYFGKYISGMTWGTRVTAAATNRITGTGWQRVSETYLRGDGARISLDVLGRLASGSAWARISASTWGRVSGGSWSRVSNPSWGRITSASMYRVSDISAQYAGALGRVTGTGWSSRVSSSAFGRITGATGARISGSAWDRISANAWTRIADQSWGRISGQTFGRITNTSWSRVSNLSWNRVTQAAFGRITAASFSRVTSAGFGRITDGLSRLQ